LADISRRYQAAIECGPKGVISSVLINSLFQAELVALLCLVAGAPLDPDPDKIKASPDEGNEQGEEFDLRRAHAEHWREPDPDTGLSLLPNMNSAAVSASGLPRMQG